MTLFEKHGGVSTVSRIVSKFYREVMKRTPLQPYFEGHEWMPEPGAAAPAAWRRVQGRVAALRSR